MNALIEALNDLITDHWAKLLLGALVTVGGWIWARYRANKEWKRREFYHRINVSLNSIHDGTLRIRTLSEKPCSEVFLNDSAVRTLVERAASTTVADPIIPLPQNEMWFYLNAVLNELSEQFAAGLIARDAGQPTKSTQYLICLTCECDGAVKTRKVRAMVIRKDLLKALPEETPEFESEVHQIRWKTLQWMAEQYESNPWKFIEMELVI